MVIKRVLPALAALLATAVSTAAQNPLGQKPANPLTARAKDPFCRAFQGDEIALQLAVAGEGRYAGVMAWRRERVACRWIYVNVRLLLATCAAGVMLLQL